MGALVLAALVGVLEEDGTISFLRVEGDAGEGGQDPTDKSVV